MTNSARTDKRTRSKRIAHTKRKRRREADFNGDEKPDYAILLASINTSKGALAVKLSNHDNYEWIVSTMTLIGMLNP